MEDKNIAAYLLRIANDLDRVPCFGVENHEIMASSIRTLKSLVNQLAYSDSTNQDTTKEETP